MSVSVLIPAHNEQEYLNRTIENIFDTATGETEVVVVLNGYDQKVDRRAKVLRYEKNTGERVAMNSAARIARGTHLLRIDAHCDFSPKGWDEMMEKVTGPETITVAVLTAIEKGTWKRLPGHWYGLCRLLPNYEAKWEKPNHHLEYRTVEPNMAFTGCGFMLRKDFYWKFGGASEHYPKMGAIGEEFAIKVWLSGGKVQTRTDVMIGHIFGTGGYDTGGVLESRKALVADYGDRYGEIAAKFPDFENVIPLRTAAVKGPDVRNVTVNREDTQTTKDETGHVLRKKIEYFRYVWVDDGTESHLTEDQVREKYIPLATKIGEEVYIIDNRGEYVLQSSEGERGGYAEPKDAQCES